MKNGLKGAAAASALSMLMGIPMALAGQPGETVGIAVGAPLPEGLYFTNTADWGCRDTTPTSCLGITIPIVNWSTPWTFVGARVQFFSVTPVIETGVSNTSYQASVFNPPLFGQLAWDLGNGLGFSYVLGAYFDVDHAVAFSSTSLNQRFALSYTGRGWDLTANVVYGIQLDSATNRPQISPCAAPFGFNGCNPDFLSRLGVAPAVAQRGQRKSALQDRRTARRMTMAAEVGSWPKSKGSAPPQVSKSRNCERSGGHLVQGT
jgi:hypothetical protein